MATAAKQRTRPDWLIPAGLIVLSLIPSLAGIFRLFQIGGVAPVTTEIARFVAVPVPIVLHLVSSLIYGLLGAFQFSPRLLGRNPKWHRNAGKALILCGLVSAISGIWLTLIYPITKPEGLPKFDGVSLYYVRLLVGVAMAWFILVGYQAIRQRDIPRHRAMMMRSYALGLGAGTQVFTHLPWFLMPSIQGELARTICMAAGWGINLAVAEWLIARRKRRQTA
jgi:uncharacterized membrane protein